MSVYIPASQLDSLKNAIFQHTSASLSGALTIAESIAWMVRGAAEEAVGQSHSELVSVDGQIRADLNTFIDDLEGTLWQMDASIREEVNNGLGILTEIVAGVDNTVSEEVTEGMTKAYDAIAESQIVAGKSIQDTIITMGESVEKSYTTVGEWIQNTTGELYGSINNTIESIMSVPSSLIDYAVEYLIPAEMQALRGAVDEVLEGGGMRSWLGTLSIKISEAISDAFSFDEKDVQEWSLKMGNIMMEQLKIKPE